jgi:hypothetical protein
VAHGARPHGDPAADRGDGPPSVEEPAPDSLVPLSAPALPGGEGEPPKSQSNKRQRNAEALRQCLHELGEALGPRELDLLVSFAEFLKARRAARGFAHHHEHMREERDAAVQSQRSSRVIEAAGSGASPASPGADKGTTT